MLSGLCLLVIGVPVSVATKDDRVLDVCALWLTWMVAVKMQYTIKTLRAPKLPPAIGSALATLINPVLVSAGIMMLYTHAKAGAQRRSLDEVLTIFSSSTTLSQVWSAALRGGDSNSDSDNWFGAGDAAISLLECGIIVWGFKLYECRGQLCSRRGLAVVLISTLLAGLNAIVSLLLARAIGLASPVALAFASRSSTLALARPSTAALGGSIAVNAGLVVGNGIVGQLVSPYILSAFRVPDERTDMEDNDGPGDHNVDGNADKIVSRQRGHQDSAIDVAVGTTIGINGAAMGVSYLYERQSRVAPYAALSMTAFGVATTMLAVLGPSKGLLKTLATGDV